MLRAAGLAGGHYFTYARTLSKVRTAEWYNYNDSYVSKMSADDVRTAAAYSECTRTPLASLPLCACCSRPSPCCTVLFYHAAQPLKAVADGLVTVASALKMMLQACCCCHPKTRWQPGRSSLTPVEVSIHRQ